MFYRSLFLLGVFCGLPQLALADVYFVGSIVGSAYDMDFNSSMTNRPASGDFLELSGATSFRIGLGANINQNFMLEAYYADYGTANSNLYSYSSTGFSQDYNFDLHPTAFVVQALASYPLAEKYSIFGKLGFASWKYDTEASYVVKQGGSTVTDLHVSGDDSGTDPLYGVGVERKLESGSRLRFDYEKLTLKSAADIKMTQFGFSYIKPF